MERVENLTALPEVAVVAANENVTEVRQIIVGIDEARVIHIGDKIWTAQGGTH